MAQINLTPQRISAMPPMPDADIVTKLEDKYTAATWSMPIDSLCRSSASDRPSGSGLQLGTDEGTLYVPMSRIALRDSNGKIPASMLPGHIDDMMYGELTFSSSAATFVEHFKDPDGTEHTRTYVSPNDESHPVPPGNIIYCDTIGANHTDLQYRYDASIPPGSKFGFMEVPGSRALTSTYGIELIPDPLDAKVTVNAKKADFFTSYSASTAETVNSTVSNLPLSSGSNKNAGIEATIESNRLTRLTKLIGGARYAMNLQIECTPVALSANVIDVSVTCGTVPAMKQQMDMSGPTSTATVLNYFCEFKNGDNNTELTVTIAAEEAITVKTTRFTVFELL